MGSISIPKSPLTLFSLQRPIVLKFEVGPETYTRAMADRHPVPVAPERRNQVVGFVAVTCRLGQLKYEIKTVNGLVWIRQLDQLLPGLIPCNHGEGFKVSYLDVVAL